MNEENETMNNEEVLDLESGNEVVITEEQSQELINDETALFEESERNENMYAAVDVIIEKTVHDTLMEAADLVARYPVKLRDPKAHAKMIAKALVEKAKEHAED